MPRRAQTTLLGLLALAGCTRGATEVVVTLSTDAPADRVLTVRATVRRGSATLGDAGTIAITAGGAAGVRLPASFAIVPGAGAPRDEPVTLVVDAQLAPSAPGQPTSVFQRIARFAFVPSRAAPLEIFLAVACGNATDGCTSVAPAQCTVSVRCEERGLTCGNDGTCVEQTVALGADAGTRGDGSGTDAINPPVDSQVIPTLPAVGHVGTLGPSSATPAPARRIFDDALDSTARSCAGTRCVTGGLGP